MEYQVIVVGAGPAGLMAAISAAQSGAKVLVLEKNQRPGLKLLATGGGRCNFTNLSLSEREWAEAFGRQGRFLLPALTAFGPEAMLAFLAEQGVATAVEEGGRAFPASHQAKDVLAALLQKASALGVRLEYNCPVSRIAPTAAGWSLQAGERHWSAAALVLSAGGCSYPLTGSSGDAYEWLKALGHQIVAPRPALTPLVLGAAAKPLEGISLAGVRLSLADSKPKLSAEGPVLFTADSLSGPAALNFSRWLATDGGQVLMIDLLPAETPESLEQRLLAWRQQQGTKQLSNLLATVLPARLVDYLLTELNLQACRAADLRADQRRQLLAKLKAWPWELRGLGGFDKAMVTAGGVALSDIDPRSMASKRQRRLFIAGELLDLDGPSGGYNLQACWSTGFLAGRSAAT